MWERARFPSKERFRQINMVQIEMNVAANPNQLTRNHVNLLRNHVQKCGFLCNVKRIP